MTATRAAPAAPARTTGTGIGLPSVAGCLATSVAVVTAGPPEHARGVTVSTLALVSHRPLLVSVALRPGAHSVAALHEHGGFAVSVLAADQSWAARHFADPDRAPGVGALRPGSWYPGRYGPLLRDAVAWLDCRLEQVIPTGDHLLVLGRADAGGVRRGRPLINFAGALHSNVLAHRDSRRWPR